MKTGFSCRKFPKIGKKNRERALARSLSVIELLKLVS